MIRQNKTLLEIFTPLILHLNDEISLCEEIGAVENNKNYISFKEKIKNIYAFIEKHKDSEIMFTKIWEERIYACSSIEIVEKGNLEPSTSVIIKENLSEVTDSGVIYSKPFSVNKNVTSDKDLFKIAQYLLLNL
jgi:hypothetical protein